jgi:divinyl chlorophyllide a 8-vinyl-reductase
LKLEAALKDEGDKGNIRYTIVRPTAFFKSVSGQLEVVQSGSPFVLFDKGRDAPITACNPIAESDLATYMIDSITETKRHNQIINLGGPDTPITMLQQGHMLFNATQKEPKFIYAPIWIFDVIINSLQFVADLFQSEQIGDMAETGRIGKYYAVEDMVTTLPNEKYGTITLQEHYNRIAVEGNDYDPYTTMFARARGIDVTAIQSEMKNTQNNTSTTTEAVTEKVMQ